MSAWSNDGQVPGTPRGRALADIAGQVQPMLESFLAAYGATRPEPWTALMPWLTWCVADGAVDGALLLLEADGARRLALVEVVVASSFLAPSQGPRAPALKQPRVTLFARRTASWAPEHAARFREVGVTPAATTPRLPAPTTIDAVWSAGDFSLVRRVC